MAYSVNGRTLVLHEGDTIIVNSNQIHYSMSLDGQLAKYVIFVVHPSILMSSVTVEMEAIRPIIDMAGHHDFNEVFFDDVLVPLGALVGERGQGWKQVTA